MEEQELISQCAKGKEKAQKRLYDCFANQMFRICLRYTGNAMDAEDVMITAFHKVFKNIQTFEYRGDGSLCKWIKTIMINESLMQLRSTKYIFEQIETYTQVADSDDSEIDAELIHQSILRLPDGYRTVVNLFIIDGLSHEEIAKQLGISVNTSKSQLSRARALLKSQLLKLEGNGK